MKLSVTEIALAWKSSVRRQSLFSCNVHERRIFACLRARARVCLRKRSSSVEIAALIMRLRGFRGKDRVSARHAAPRTFEFWNSFPFEHGSRSLATGISPGDVFVPWMRLLREITPRYGRNLAVLTTWKHRSVVSRRSLDVTIHVVCVLKWVGPRSR